MKTATSTITTRYQTSIPKTVRTALGVGPGDRIRYIFEGGAVRLVALKPVGRLYGVLKHDARPLSLQGMDRGIADGVSRK